MHLRAPACDCVQLLQSHAAPHSRESFRNGQDDGEEDEDEDEDEDDDDEEEEERPDGSGGVVASPKRRRKKKPLVDMAPPGLAPEEVSVGMLVGMTLYLVERAMAQTAWNIKKLDAYPTKRKHIVPYLL